MPPTQLGGSEIYEDGEPVSEQLGDDESITVPNGETWVVTITLSQNKPDNFSKTRVKINGTTVTARNTGVAPENWSFQTVLKSGDTVSTSGNVRSQIGGWAL
jgi:hypothetical protein